LIRVVRLKNIERTKRKIGIAAARKAMILKIIVHCQCRVTRAASLDHLVGAGEHCGGTVRSSIVAVWALMTSSNLFDCTTGRSAGLAPLRMRPA